MDIETTVKTIFLVDDDREDLDLITEVFHEFSPGNNLLTFADGHELIEYVDQKKGSRPDFVITDMNMPVVSGFEVVEYLKCKKDFFRTPIIMLSASGAQEDIQKAYDTGVDYYIKKPTDYKEMFTIIESISNWMDHRALAFR